MPRPTGLALGFLAAYVGLAIAAYAWTTTPQGMSVLWVNNGVLTAAMLLLPRRQAVVVATLCILADCISARVTGSSWARAAVIGGCDLVEVGVAAALIRRFCGAALDMSKLARLRNMAILGALPATVIAGTIGSALMALMFKESFAHAWAPWTLGDFLGMMIGAPAALLLARFRRYDVGPRVPLLERAGLILLVAATAFVIFTHGDKPLLFLIFPVGLLALIRLSTPYAALAVVIIGFIAARATVMGQGPISAATQGDMAGQALFLQFYLANVLFSAIVLSSVLAQRGRAQAGLRRALAASRAARKEAVEAAGAKGRFLAVMSHEMRTPLNGIAGYAQLLTARGDLPQQARDQLRVMRTSCQVLQALINDVLDYSRMESGDIRLDIAPFNLADLLAQSIDIVRPRVSHKPVELSLDAGEIEGGLYLGDERRVVQVLLNLLSNAAKFTDRGDIIVTATRREGPDDAQLVRISVRDSGIGVPADKLHLLFQPFSQVDGGSTRNFDGAGLGLTIAKSLVERMRGEIGVTSEVEAGSEFWFEIPLQAAGLADPLPFPEPVIVPVRADPAPGAPRILVVDDHPVNRQVACLMLMAGGYEVEWVEDGAQALDTLRNGDFDLVFMDLHMPVMDGLSACRAIRGMEGPAGQIPVIAMTAAALPEDVARCMAVGMNAHIAKPIDNERLMQVAQEHLPRVRVTPNGARRFG